MSGEQKDHGITPDWCERMADLEDGCEIGAGVQLHWSGVLLSMWARRHEISDKEWRDAGPVLLGIALASLRTPTKAPDHG